MTPRLAIRLAIALVRRGGVALLVATALGWWCVHLDTTTRAERAAQEESFRKERLEERLAFKEALEKCLARVNERVIKWNR